MALNSEQVKNLIAKIDDLPTLPNVITKIMEILENPKSTARDIDNVIKTDQTLTAKTLKMVNSAYYGFPRRITTVTDAVVILGFNTVKSLALSATVCKMFLGGNKDFDREALWEHSIAVAFASRIIAKRIKYADEESAFVAGLLHDIAKIVEDQYFHEEFMNAVRKSRENEVSLLDTERDELGMDHTLIGRRIADKWNLPLNITKVIGYHHQPEFAGAEDQEITSIVHVADIVVKIRKIGDSGNYGPIEINKTAIAILKLTKKDLAEIVQKLLQEIKLAEEFLKIIRE